MNRRRFLNALGAAIAGAAADRIIPFNRVWSIPQNVKPAWMRDGALWILESTAMGRAGFFAEEFERQSRILAVFRHPGNMTVMSSQLKTPVQLRKVFISEIAAWPPEEFQYTSPVDI